MCAKLKISSNAYCIAKFSPNSSSKEHNLNIYQCRLSSGKRVSSSSDFMKTFFKIVRLVFQIWVTAFVMVHAHSHTDLRLPFRPTTTCSDK